MRNNKLNRSGLKFDTYHILIIVTTAKYTNILSISIYVLELFSPFIPLYI